MMHKAWSSIEEVPYCFAKSSVKFQGHTALKIIEFDPNWAFPDCNSSLNSPMAAKWCTKLEVAWKRCPIVFSYDQATLWMVFSVRLSVCHTFYPRPVLAFGYCHRLCVCVLTFFVWVITHLTFQLESSNLDKKIQQILLKVPIVFGVDWLWPSRSNLTPFQNSVVVSWTVAQPNDSAHMCIYRFQYTRWHGRATDRETV